MEELELQELKKKYGKIYTLSVPVGDDDNEKIVDIHLRKLDPINYSASMNHIKNGNPLKAAETILRNLRVGGVSAETIINDFDALRSAEISIAKLFETKSSELKKN